MQPVMRRIDHLILRVGDPNYQTLLHTLTETLGLYSPWPVAQHPAFKSGGVFAGNVDFELLSLASHEQSAARLYGIAFELHEWSTAALAARATSFVAVPYIQQEPGQGAIKKWLNVFLPNLVGSNGWMRTYFMLAGWIPARMWERLGSGDNANNAAAVDFIFNKVYRQGLVFAVKYNPSWRDIDRERQESIQQHEARQGGHLGVKAVDEVVIGVRDMEKSAAYWANLLGHPSESAPVWRIGDGPAVRLVDHTHDAMLSMTWAVRSLGAAHAYLADTHMLGADAGTTTQIDPAALCGLDVRLIERA